MGRDRVPSGEVSPAVLLGGAIRFGNCLCDLEARELSRDGARVEVSSKAFDLLAALLANRPRVLTKDELHDRLWPSSYVGDTSLPKLVAELRKATGDDAREPLYIRTVHRFGYAFSGDAEEVTPPGRPQPRPRPGVDGEPAEELPRKPLSRRLAAIWPAAAAVAGLGVMWLLMGRSGGTDVRRPTPRPVTSYPGAELQPALSPQGDRIAYQWRGEDGNEDIYVKLIREEPPLRLTDDPASECCPSWSPDGQRIAFLRINGVEPGIYLVPSLGGRERLLHATSTWFGSALSWTPDGEAIVFSASSGPGEPHRIWSLSLDSLETRPLTDPGPGAMGDALPSVCPTGREVAFARIAASGDLLRTADLFVTPLEGGSPRQLTRRGSFIGGLDWFHDGTSIVFAVRAGEAVEVHEIHPAGGESRVVVTPWFDAADRNFESPRLPSRAFRVSASRGRPLIAYANALFDLNIWRLALPDLLKREPLIVSTYNESGPNYSPDGTQIAFNSRRTGPSEVWACAHDGSACATLTQLGGHSGSPSWSPDGRTVAFDTRPHGNADVYLLDVATNNRRRFTQNPAEDVVPSWSADGHWVYFSSNRSGRWQIWRKPAAGDGSAVQITSDGGFSSAESPEGRWLYHARLDEPGLWRMPAHGGSAERVTGDVGCWGYWTLGRRGVYVVKTSPERPLLELLPWDTAEPIALGQLPELPACADGGMDVSPDESTLLLVQTDLVQGDLLVLENPG